MDRRDFYFQQLVTEADLDEVFELAEAADHNYVIDNGLVGVYFGLDVAEAGVPNLTVQVSAGAAYDQTGQRIAVPSTQIVNVAVDSNAVSTTVAGVGNSKIISVYAKFKRVLGNPKTDGNNVSVQYDRDESYEFIVRQSTEAVGPTPPALQADEILLADITRVFGGTTVVNAAINPLGVDGRRQWAISATSGNYTVRTGRADTAIQSVVELIDGLDTDAAANLQLHLDDATAAHAASAVANTPAGSIAATTVQAALNELDSEKGGLATSNTWTAANNFTGTTHTWLNTSDTLRVHKRTNGSSAKGFTLQDQRTHAAVTAFGTIIEVIAAANLPDGCRGTLTLIVSAVREATIDTFATAHFVTSFKKTGGAVTVTNGSTPVTAYGTAIGSPTIEESSGGLGLGLTTVGSCNLEMSFTVAVSLI